MRKKIMFGLAGLLSIACLLGCNNNSGTTNPDSKVVIDLMERSVTIPSNVEKVVCIGAGSLRLYSYIGDMDKLSGVEMIEKTTSPMKLPKRPYQVANQELFDSLPLCGTGGPKGQQAEIEKLLICRPDVIFSTIKDVEAMNEITSTINVPTIILDYGPNGAFELNDEKNNLKKSINILGEVLNKKERAKTINDSISNIIKDLNNRTKNIKENEKPSVYLGALGNFGMHGLDSSQPHYPLLDIINAKNVLDSFDLTMKKETNIPPEILTVADPDYVFIDAGGIDKTIDQLKTDEKLSPIYKKWSAFKNNKVFVNLPYKVYFMQIEIGLIDAYYVGKTIYPESFNDVDINELAKNTFMTFNQVDCYENYLAAANLKDKVFTNFIYE